MMASKELPPSADAKDEEPCSAALIVHVFYLDLFDEILERVARLPVRHKLFVTTTAEHHEVLRRILDGSKRAYTLRTVDNRGRDVLPFLSLLPQARDEGFGILIKVHTKKSAHRKDGSRWRTDILDSLLRPDFVGRALDAFARDPKLGMIGPEGHYVPMSTYYGANEERILSIGAKLHLSEPEILAQGFFAGTMFLARTSALAPLAALGFTPEDFEPEAGQKDGTLAHALERGMALCVRASGYRLASSGHLDAPARFHGTYSFAKGRRASAGPLGRLGDRARTFERRIRRFLRGQHQTPGD
jgi:lipopolysaccharide biosynthesis protein